MEKKTRKRIVDWYSRVARWRKANPKERFTPSDATLACTSYYFRLARFTHCVEARTLCQMTYGDPHR